MHYTMNFGMFLLGFTGAMKCAHCNNTVEFEIRQQYEKGSIISVIPLPTTWLGVFKLCPVCEDLSALTRGPLFTTAKALTDLGNLLDGGKEKTKRYIQQLSQKEQEIVLKRLNKLKAYALVQYIGT